MKKLIIALFIAAFAVNTNAAPWDLTRLISAGVKSYQAMSLTDAQMAEYCKESVEYMDSQNPVAAASDPYAQRLARLTKGLTSVGGTPLNFKVYKVTDVNAFACPDGSVRVFAGIMDVMTDDELLGIIGHEVGHVALHHSKNAFKKQLYSDALKDAIASTGGRAAALADGTLSSLASSLSSAKYSQKQEKEADDYGYEFLKKCGKNPWGMVQSFEKLQQLEGNSASATSYFAKMFSSHPDTKERINRLTKRAKKDGIARP